METVEMDPSNAALSLLLSVASRRQPPAPVALREGKRSLYDDELFSYVLRARCSIVGSICRSL